MLNFNDPQELERGSQALRCAIEQYVAEFVAGRVKNRVLKSWHCVKCLANGQVASTCGEALVEAIRSQHRRWRRVAGCHFDQDCIIVSPIAPMAFPVLFPMTEAQPAVMTAGAAR